MPLKSFYRKLLRVSVEELFLFLLRVEFAGAKLLEIIVLLQGVELLLQDRCGFHRSQDRGDEPVDFERCRLVARSLADNDLLDELAHEADEGLRRFRVGVLAHVIEGGVDDQFDGFRTDFRLQVGA